MRKAALNVVIPRELREVRKNAQNETISPDDEKTVAITALRDMPAWVLLGEPGAGKTTIFRNEAEACAGEYRTIREFIHDAVNEELQGKTLFLDGLDEVRADSAEGSVLTRVAVKLKENHVSRFRIACRAADWYGSSDIDSLSRVSSRDIKTFQLCPITDQDVHDILEQNFGLENPRDFIATASEYRIQELLYNPQTLGLMVSVVQTDGAWPSSRLEVFDKACKIQVGEENKLYRNSERQNDKKDKTTFSDEDLLNAAGYLFSAMLLGNKAGFALDKNAATTSFPNLEAYAPSDLVAARAVVKRGLFMLSDTVETMVPSHRSISEFLAAQWLAKQVDKHHLPIGRLCNLILGFDGKPVSDLRGLYAWLATQSSTLRERFLNADPLIVIRYGDVKPMAVALKQQLLSALETLAHTQATVLRHALYDMRKTSAFSALFDPELVPDFLVVLASPKRDDGQQIYVQCVLAILENNPIKGELILVLKRIIEDGRYDAVCRYDALEVWLSHVSDSEATALLDAIQGGDVDDSDDELMGRLLRVLYPKHFLSPETVLRYLHWPKNKGLIGSYKDFWIYDFPKYTQDSCLPILIEQLIGRSDLLATDSVESLVLDVANALVTKGVEIHGDHITDDQLFAWLRIGNDVYGETSRDPACQDRLTTWISERPNRYKGLLAIVYADAKNNYSMSRYLLSSCEPPEDIGLWCFQNLIKETNEKSGGLYLDRAISTLETTKGNTGLTIDMIQEWAQKDPNRQAMLAPYLYQEIPDYLKKNALRRKEYESKQSQNRDDRSLAILKALSEIKAGTASIGILSQLAKVWYGRYYDLSGNTPKERYEKAYENSEQLYNAAQEAFRSCVFRDDIPSLQDILDIYIKGQEYNIGLPLLIGAQLRWEEDPTFIDQLPNDTLASLFCFYVLAAPHITAKWSSTIIVQKTNLVADVLVKYASLCFAKKRETGYVFSQLLHESSYYDVARTAIPQLLQKFPLKSTAAQLGDLKALLQAGLRYVEAEMPHLIAQRIARKSLDMPQRMYWLTAGMVLAPDVYEEKLWDYVGNSWKKVQLILSFLGQERGFFVSFLAKLSAPTLGKLIEISTPNAVFAWPSTDAIVTLSRAVELAPQIQTLVYVLSERVSEESHQELSRLLSLPALLPIKHHLENARNTLQQHLREQKFMVLPLAKIVSILHNSAPANAKDLLDLTLAHLEDIALDIDENNSDLYRPFWTEDKINNTHKEENSCRDAILSRLKERFASVDVQCDPEVDAVGDKRTDIRLSYKTEFELPIEVKGEWNSALWTGIQNQLINQYINSRSDGYGIYLVLWFGGKDQKPAGDGGKKPSSPDELRERLQNHVPKDKQSQIHVVVLDLHWPENSKSQRAAQR